MRARFIVCFVASSLSLSCAGAGEEGDATTIDCSEGQCDVAGNEALCQWKVAHKGTFDVEKDYLPRVIACENGEADFEALKAQAVAARSYLYYVARVEKRSLADSQGDQVFTCGRKPGPEHFRAVNETAGQVITYQHSYVASFFVAGAIQAMPTCEDGTRDPTRTEKFVTYNAGRSGTDIIQSKLGFRSPTNLANRGCMSQNGSHCLSQIGFSHMDLLRYYYGDDIEVTQMVGSCVKPAGDVGSTAGIGTPCTGDPMCNFMANGETGECLTWFDMATQKDAGFCSVACDGTCPASGTACVETTTGQGFGQCAKLSTAANQFCKQIPGTQNKVMGRFVGTSTTNEVQTVCAPPTAPAMRCTSAGRSGNCVDTDTTNCGGQLATNACPGDNSIRCCLQ